VFIGLWSGGRNALLAVLLSGILAQVYAAEREALIPPYTYIQFRAYQGEHFRVWGGEGLGRVIELTLERLDQGQSDLKVEQFALYFSGPSDYLLDKNSYTFEHPDSGVFRLWLEPFDNKNEEQQWYRVEFNLLK